MATFEVGDYAMFRRSLQLGVGHQWNTGDVVRCTRVTDSDYTFVAENGYVTRLPRPWVRENMERTAPPLRVGDRFEIARTFQGTSRRFNAGEAVVCVIAQGGPSGVFHAVADGAVMTFINGVGNGYLRRIGGDGEPNNEAEMNDDAPTEVPPRLSIVENIVTLRTFRIGTKFIVTAHHEDGRVTLMPLGPATVNIRFVSLESLRVLLRPRELPHAVAAWELTRTARPACQPEPKAHRLITLEE